VLALQPGQARSQFNLWCVLAAPLLIGSSVLNMTPFDLQTYTNREAIAISQDPRGQQGFVVWSDCPPVTVHRVPRCAQVWARPLSYNGSFALVFVNFAELPQPRVVLCRAACMQRACGSACPPGGRYNIRDVWRKTDGVGQSVQVLLEGGASAMFVVTPEAAAARGRMAPSPTQSREEPFGDLTVQ
jgi:alpha-galactosidase